MSNCVIPRLKLVLQLLFFIAISNHAESVPPRNIYIGEVPLADTIIDCNSGGKCPDGWICVPALGQCGIPVGQGCYDLGTDWWTGRDALPGYQMVMESPSPVSFDIVNEGNVPIYFESSISHPVLFNLFYKRNGQTFKLELPENHFCPNLCPDQGPPAELDCGKPPLVVQRLLPGNHLRIEWSGLEQVIMRRFCISLPVKTCYVERISIPGTYIIEINAFAGISGGQPDAANPDRWTGAKPTGLSNRLRVTFQYPASAPVKISLVR